MVLALAALLAGSIAGLSVVPQADAATTLGNNIATLAKAQIKTDYSTYAPAGADWCAYFAKWVWQQSGADVTGVNGYANSFSAAPVASGATVHTETNYLPQPGDVVVFGDPSYPTPAHAVHVGIVISATGTASSYSLTYVDGNGYPGGDKVASRTEPGPITRLPYNIPGSGSKMYIGAYVTPKAVSATTTPTCTTPGAVTGVKVTPTTATSATITWNAVAGAAKYDVEYSTPISNGWKPECTGVTGTSCLSSGLVTDYLYQYRVRAISACGAASAWVSVNYTKPVTTGITIISATPDKTSGLSTDKYTYKIVTNVIAAKLVFTYNGNTNAYTVTPGNATALATAATATRSADGLTWTITGDLLSAGSRTISVVAYDAAGKASAAKSMSITVK